jgi:uncharacterized protein (DUF433 family)
MVRAMADAQTVIHFEGRPLLWQDPGRVSGAMCFYGSRLTVATVLELLVDGVSLEEIEDGYPTATPGEVRRLVRYLGSLVDEGGEGALSDEDLLGEYEVAFHRHDTLLREIDRRGIRGKIGPLT